MGASVKFDVEIIGGGSSQLTIRFNRLQRQRKVPCLENT